MKRYNTIKIFLSDDEKRQRALDFIDFGDGWVDVDEFVKKDIFDEFIHMKCIKCDYEETLEFDIVVELMFGVDGDYPELVCAKCSHKKNGGHLVPLDIFNSDFKK